MWMGGGWVGGWWANCFVFSSVRAVSLAFLSFQACFPLSFLGGASGVPLEAQKPLFLGCGLGNNNFFGSQITRIVVLRNSEAVCEQ